MYVCYIDESGVPEHASTSHFVLIGLAIIAEDWKWMDNRLSAIKKQYGLENSEIHTAWMARRYGEQDAVPNFDQLSWEDRRKATENMRKQHLIQLAATGTKRQLDSAKKSNRKTAAYLHLTHNERLNCLRDLADALGGWQEARLFAEAADKDYVYGQTHLRTPLFEYAFTEVVQRYEYFLKNKGNSINTTLWGMIVQDNNETMARKITNLMRKFHRQGTRWTNIDHIIETPLFVDSQLTSMVQLADLCGYATRRFFENNETDLFDRIYSRFDRGTRGVVGIRHNTDSGCDCQVCRDHS